MRREKTFSLNNAKEQFSRTRKMIQLWWCLGKSSCNKRKSQRQTNRKRKSENIKDRKLKLEAFEERCHKNKQSLPNLSSVYVHQKQSSTNFFRFLYKIAIRIFPKTKIYFLSTWMIDILLWKFPETKEFFLFYSS